jgi:orotate phosphoribosyltransferase
VREAFDLITSNGAEAAGLAISLDRQERGQGSLSAVQELKSSLGIPVISIIRLDDLIDILEESEDYAAFIGPVVAYRRKYGVAA